MKFSVYLAHPPKTDPELKEQIISQISSHGFSVLDPFNLGPDLESAGSDPKLRKLLAPNIFRSNVQAINNAGLVVALIAPGSPHDPDQGVLWEMGYALSIGTPVILFKGDSDGSSWGKWSDYLGDFTEFFPTAEDLDTLGVLIEENYPSRDDYLLPSFPRPSESSGIALQVAVEDDLPVRVPVLNARVYFIERPGSLRELLFIQSHHHSLILQTDDRHPYVSFLVGLAYGQGRPVMTYSLRGYGLNIMLQQSVIYHLIEEKREEGE